MATERSSSDERGTTATAKGAGGVPSAHGAAADPATATEALRTAVEELHHSEDEASQRYAADLEEATRRFEMTLALTEAHLLADRAESTDELTSVVTDLVTGWRARADELRVRAHVGQMDVRDLVSNAVTELDQTTQRLGVAVSRVRDEAGGTLASMRREVTAALDDVARIVKGRPD